MTGGMPTQPSGWPIREPGFFLGYIGHLFFVSIDRSVTEGAMDVFFRELKRSIDLRADDDRVAAMYHVGQFQALSIAQYKRLGSIVKPRKAKLKQTTAALALCTQSPFARAALKTVLSVATLPYPTMVFSKMPAALDFLQRAIPAIDSAAALRIYREIVTASLPGLRSDLE